MNTANVSLLTTTLILDSIIPNGKTIILNNEKKNIKKLATYPLAHHYPTQVDPLTTTIDLVVVPL